VILSEDQECEEFSIWLDRRKLLYTHVPNGGLRNPVEASKLKRMGVKPGVPDYLIFEPSFCGLSICPTCIDEIRHLGIAIEMKRTRGSQADVKPKQLAWLSALREKGWLTHVAFGHLDAVRWMESLGYA